MRALPSHLGPSRKPARGRSPPDVFLADTHWTCLDALVGSLLAGTPLIAVCGEPGSGKSTVVNAALRRLEQQPIRFVHTAAPSLRLLDQRGMPAPQTLDRFARVLTKQLRRVSGNRSVNDLERVCLVVDDAETLSVQALYFLQRLIEAPALKKGPPVLLFVGRPEFWEQLEHPALTELRKGIAARLWLSPLSEEGVRLYAEHVIRRLGLPEGTAISNAAMRTLVRAAHGNPRQINAMLMDRFMRDAALRRRIEASAALDIAGPDGRGACLPMPATKALSGPLASWPKHELSGVPEQHVLGTPLFPRSYRATMLAGAMLLCAAAGVFPWPLTRSREARPLFPGSVATVPLGSGSSPARPDPGGSEPPPPPARASVAAASPGATGLPTFGAPPELKPDLPTPDLSAARAPGTVPALIKRGREMLDRRDVMAARLLFERAAALAPENRSAAVAAGETYDPEVLKEIGARTLTPAPDKAARWYETAKALGDREADTRLRQLRENTGAEAYIAAAGKPPP